FEKLGGGRLQWTRIEGAWDEAELPGGPRIEYRPGFRDHLAHLFPRERDGLARYFRLLHDAAAAMRARFIARTAPATDALSLARTDDVIASCTRDPHLHAALALHWVFYGTPPHRSAFGVHAL